MECTLLCDSVLKVYCLFCPGGFFHGLKDLTYGVDVEQVRWMGILQVCSLVYVSGIQTKEFSLGSKFFPAADFVVKFFSDVFLRVCESNSLAIKNCAGKLADSTLIACAVMINIG